MLIKGLDRINNILSIDELNTIQALMMDKYNSKGLQSEANNFYTNSYGNDLDFSSIHDRLTALVSVHTGYKLVKQNNYSRIYLNGSDLKPHKDRVGLDLTLSVQIFNTFQTVTPIFAKSYNGCVYGVNLGNGDGLLLHGRELDHWRNPLAGDGMLGCTFFHWSIVGLEYQEFDNFLSKEECEIILKEKMNYTASMVLVNGKANVYEDIRSNEVAMYKNDTINKKLAKLICGSTDMGKLDLEGLQMLKYIPGQKFTPHLDSKHNGRFRLFTTIIYLNDDYEGGETNFTNENIKIEPKIGKLIIWKNIKNGEENLASMHESKPVIKGTKNVLVNWILE